MHADVRVIDPVWTTQTIANIHGALIYDTLFGNDADQKPQPQMVGKYEVSPDRLLYTFTLRDALKFHDGSPVTTKDVIASLKRWGAKDGVGQRLLGYVSEMKAVDDKTFTMALKEPYGMVLESLGKSGSSIAAIMREKEALTDAQTQVKEAIGSDPYVFAKDQWVPGSKAVYLKNKDYVPRTEAPSSFAGAKIPGVDRIELRRMNMIDPGAMPYRNAVGMNYDSGRYEENMDWAMDIADWNGFDERKREAAKRGKLLGRGLANYVESSIGAPNEQARITVRPEGRVDVVIGTQPSGQGHETSFAQVTADALGVPIEWVTVVGGDTAAVPFGIGTFASRSGVTAGNSIADAARQVRGKLIDHAAGSIARYKLPKAIVFRPVIERSPAGKADYRWAREQAISGGA